MTEHREASLTLGIFSDRAAAESARKALERAGVAGDEITVISPDRADARALAAITGLNPGEWQEHLDELDASLVLVTSAARQPEIETLLRAQGAREVVGGTSLAQPPATPAPPADRPEPAIAARIRPGMLVMSAERREVGRVDRIERGSIHITRPLRRDVWVPLTAVADVIEQWVVLRLPFSEVDLPASFLLER
jgi:hypothetical protein